LGLARSEGEAGQLGWRGAEEVARLGGGVGPRRVAKGAGEEAERGRRWRWALGRSRWGSRPVGDGSGPVRRSWPTRARAIWAWRRGRLDRGELGLRGGAGELGWCGGPRGGARLPRSRSDRGGRGGGARW